MRPGSAYFITRVLLLISVLLILFSCTTQDGITVSTGDRGSLYVSAGTGAEECRIYINNLSTDYFAPTTVELYPGLYTIKVRQAGFVSTPDSVNISIEEKQLSEIHFDLTAVSSGNLSVTTRNGAVSLRLDGLLMPDGQRDFPGLARGHHILISRKAGYYSAIDTVLVEANKTTALSVDLTRKSQVFLLEHFSNVSCTPCAEMDAVLEEFLAAHDSVEIVPLAWHTNFPSESDPMYLSAIDACSGRTEYYGVDATPAFFMNGSEVTAYTSRSLTRALDSYISVNQPDSSFELLTITLNPFPDISGRITLRSRENIGAGLILRLAVTETEIAYDTPPGTNGQTHFSHVVRDLQEFDENGTLQMGAGEEKSWPFSFEYRNEWEGRLQLIAFVQDESDRSVKICAVSEAIIMTGE